MANANICTREELDFLSDTYGDRSWHVSEIANELGWTVKKVYAKASYLGLKRGRRRVDWKAVDRLRRQGMTVRGVAKQLGCSRGAVCGALRNMKKWGASCD